MFGRLVLAGAAALALGVSPVLAGGPSILPALLLAKDCFKSDAAQVQCAIQVAKGNRNDAATTQWTRSHGHGQSLQLGVTIQDGNDNRALTRQIGKDQLALTVQKGDDNSSYVNQVGKDQISANVQVGNGHWAANSSIGEKSHSFIVQSN